jgi:hypothetical protein
MHWQATLLVAIRCGMQRDSVHLLKPSQRQTGHPDRSLAGDCDHRADTKMETDVSPSADLLLRMRGAVHLYDEQQVDDYWVYPIQR